MSKHSHLILIISISSLFSSLVPAQERVQETRLLAKIQKYEEFGPKPSGSLGSKLFVYTRFDPDQDGSNLFRIEANKEVPVFSSPSAGTGGYIHSIQVSKDDSRIVFVKSGMSHHHRTVIYSVRPDGTQLTELVGSGDDCKGFKPIPPYYGSPHCSVPRFPRLSPEGKRLLFINEVREWDEESQTNPTRLYLSIVPVTGAPIVRLEEVGNNYDAVWSEDGSSIYYHSSKVPDQTWEYVPRRYDLKTGRSEPLTDASWKTWRPLALSRADGALYFISEQGFVRLDPETGFAEVLFEERFDSFNLSPDGRRAAVLKGNDVIILDLEFPSSNPLQAEQVAEDELALGQILAARERLVTQRMSGASMSTSSTEIVSRVSKAIEVKQVLWIDNERLWCVVHHENTSIDPITASSPEVRVGIAQLY